MGSNVTLTMLPDAGVMWVRLVGATIEVTIFAVVAAILAWLGGGRQPRVIAILWLLVLVKPLISIAAGSPISVYSVDAGMFHPDPVLWRAEPAANEAIVTLSSADNGDGGLAKKLYPALHIDLRAGLLALWVIGVSIAVIRIQHDRRQVLALVRSGRRPPGHVMRAVRRTARELGLRRAPDVVVSGALDSPAIVGYLSPIVVLPAWMVKPGSEDTLAWSLRHELTHWRLGDTIANGVRRISCAVFFFHPAVWYAGKKWEVYAELACDRAVITNAHDRQHYAEALYRVLDAARNPRIAAARSGLFAARTQIGRRVAALMAPELYRTPRARILYAATVLMAGGMFLLAGAGGDTPYARIVDWGGGAPGNRNVDIELVEARDGHEYYLRAKGQFAYAGNTIVAASPGAFGAIEDRHGGEVTRFQLNGLNDGDYTIQYSKNGTVVPFDNESRRWLLRVLSKFSSDQDLVRGWRGLTRGLLLSNESFGLPPTQQRAVYASIAELVSTEINASGIVQNTEDLSIAEQIARDVTGQLASELRTAPDGSRVKVISPREEIRETIRQQVRETVKKQQITIDPSRARDIDRLIDRVSIAVSEVML